MRCIAGGAACRCARRAEYTVLPNVWLRRHVRRGTQTVVARGEPRRLTRHRHHARPEDQVVARHRLAPCRRLPCTFCSRSELCCTPCSSMVRPAHLCRSPHCIGSRLQTFATPPHAADGQRASSLPPTSSTPSLPRSRKRRQVQGALRHVRR